MAPWQGWGQPYDHGKNWGEPPTSLQQEVAQLRKMVVEGYTDPAAKGKGKGKGKSETDPKGKGKGKESKGKGKGKDAFWPCPEELCKTRLNKGVVYWNHPGRCECNLCKAPRGAAPAIAEDNKAKVLEEVRAEVAAAHAGKAAPAVAPMSNTQAKKLRNAQKKKDHEAAKPGDGDASADDSSDMATEEDPLPTDAQIAAAMKLLGNPQPLKEGWTPEAAVRDIAAEGATESLTELKNEQAACNKVVDLVSGGIALAGVDVAATKARLTALSKAIDKATKDVPTTAVNAAQLSLKKELYLEARTEKLGFVGKGAASAKENFEKARALHRRMEEHWTARLEAMEEEEVVRQEAYRERNKLHEERHLQVLAEFDKDIAAAVQTAVEAAAKLAGGAVATPEPVANVAPAVLAETEAEKKEKEEKIKVWEAAREAFRKLDATPQTPVQKDDLPDLSASPPISAEDMPSMTQMYHWARASVLGDAHLPFSFAEMGITIQVGKYLAGKTIWEQFFGDCAISTQDVCPMQLRQVVFMQLMAHDAQLRSDKKSADAEKAATKSFEATVPRLQTMKKTLRSSPYPLK